MATTTNGIIVPDLSDDNNPPADFLSVGNQIDALYGRTVADAASLPVSGAFPGQKIYLEDVDALAWWDAKTTAWQGYERSYTPTIAGTSAATVTLATYVIDEHETVTVSFLITLTAAMTSQFLLNTPSGVNMHANE